MKLTKQNIHAALNWGSPNGKQCKILGVTYPLPHGWLSALIGSEIPDADYERLCSLRRKGRGLQDKHQVEREPEPAITASAESPEDFANDLFRESEGKLD